MPEGFPDPNHKTSPEEGSAEDFVSKRGSANFDPGAEALRDQEELGRSAAEYSISLQENPRDPEHDAHANLGDIEAPKMSSESAPSSTLSHQEAVLQDFEQFEQAIQESSISPSSEEAPKDRNTPRTNSD